MFKVVVSDLDGTLLNKQHQVSARTRETLHTLVKRGIKFMVATGRHHVDVQGIRDTLGLDIFLITANGAVVHDKQDNCIYNQSLPSELAQQVVELPRHQDIRINLYQGDRWLVAQESPELLAFHQESGFGYQVVDPLRVDKQNINKIFFTAESHEALLPLEASLLQRFGDALAITFASADSLEVMPKGVNKGNAVQAVLAQNGLRLEETIAFGDGMNDLEMLSLVGRGVVMGNAHDRLMKALPDHDRTHSSDEDGVARYLERLFG